MDAVEAMELQMVVTSIVLHQLPTAGISSIDDIADRIDFPADRGSRPD